MDVDKQYIKYNQNFTHEGYLMVEVEEFMSKEMALKALPFFKTTKIYADAESSN